MLKTGFIAALVLVIVSSPLAWGQAYKWRDADGRIQYADTPPPPGAKDVQQLRKPPSGPTSNSPSKSIAEQDAAFRKRLIEKQETEAKQTKAAEEAKVRARNCEQAKGQVAALDAGGRMVKLNAQGERIALDDAERAQSRAEALKAVEDWCK